MDERDKQTYFTTMTTGAGNAENTEVSKMHAVVSLSDLTFSLHVQM